MLWDYNANLDSECEKKKLLDIIGNFNGNVALFLVKKSDIRTNDLNRYYFVCLQYISDYTGMESGYLHNKFKAMFIPNVKWGVYSKLTTTELSTAEMMQYIGWIKSYALSEFNVVVPDQYNYIRP